MGVKTSCCGSVQFSLIFKSPNTVPSSGKSSTRQDSWSLLIYNFGWCSLGYSDSTQSLQFQSQCGLNSLTSEPQFQIPGTENSIGSSWVRLVERHSGILRECFLKKLYQPLSNRFKGRLEAHFSPGIGRPHPSCPIWPAAYFCKVLLEHSSTYLLTYYLWLFSALQYQSGRDATEIGWPPKSKYLPLPLHRKCLPTLCQCIYLSVSLD